LILVGPGWKSVIDQFVTVFDGYVLLRHREWLYFAPDVEAVLAFLPGHT
jgi:hypothetical protein